jgi:hypothetical protein
VTQAKTGKRQVIEYTPALASCVASLKSLGPAIRPTLVCTRRGVVYTLMDSQLCGNDSWPVR